MGSGELSSSQNISLQILKYNSITIKLAVFKHNKHNDHIKPIPNIHCSVLRDHYVSSESN